MENATVISVTGKLDYINIFQPKTLAGSVVGGYSVIVIISKDDIVTIAALQHAIEKAAKGLGVEYTSPLYDGDVEKPDQVEYRNSYFIKVSTKRKPEVIDSNNTQVHETAVGRFEIATVTLEVFQYYRVRKGVACNLLKVELPKAVNTVLVVNNESREICRELFTGYTPLIGSRITVDDLQLVVEHVTWDTCKRIIEIETVRLPA